MVTFASAGSTVVSAFRDVLDRTVPAPTESKASGR